MTVEHPLTLTRRAGRRGSPATVLAVVAAAIALIAAFTVAAVGPAAAEPVEGDPTIRSEGTLQFSPDGETWHDAAADGVGQWQGIDNLSPGDSGSRTYYIKNSGDAPGTLELSIENLQKSEYALFTVWNTIDGADGDTFVVYGPEFGDSLVHLGPPLEEGQVLNTIELEPGQVVEVTDHVGMPDEQHRESMGSNFVADFVWTLTADCTDTPSPAGSLGSLFGSLGSLGSLGGQDSACPAPEAGSTAAFGSESGS
ncbi:hypothetical protein [Tomitella gaofuii]|uniref:hypothetical protein n=1 Tax=Tomitella gaofuii TaxID=2760083 RepID=UPI0015FB3C56|nr:hypothetical protein [Tomitella gaofuii]